ncbi:MAG: HdeD family acid-resistance protein [Bacteroidota bacterium]
MADTSSTDIAQEVKKSSGWLLLTGILFIVAGIFAIAYPLAATGGGVLMIGWLLVVGGIFRFFDAFATRQGGGFAWKVIGSILYVLAGIVTLKHPMGGALTLTLVLGTFFVIEGISKTAAAIELKPLKGWGWAMFDGVLGILLGIIVLVFLPGASLWLVGMLLGIKLIFAGWDLTFFSLVLKKA